MQAYLNYEGSLSMDRDLMDAAERGRGVICVNGAAAHLVRVGDLIIATYRLVARADEKNRVTGTEPEVAGPKTAPKRQ